MGNLCIMVGGNGKEAVYLPTVPVMLRRARKDLVMVLFPRGKLEGIGTMVLVCIHLVWKVGAVGNLCKMVGSNGKEDLYLRNVPVMLKQVPRGLLMVLFPRGSGSKVLVRILLVWKVGALGNLCRMVGSMSLWR